MSQVASEQPPAMPARPTSAHSAQAVQQPQQSQSETPPTHPATQPIPGLTANTTEPQTLREKLNAGDAHWEWKIAMRIITVIIGIIGIGCAAWVTVKYGPGKNPSDYELDDAWSMPWTLITFCLSVVWSLACILVFFLRRPNAPVHPGAQVGMDLVLWLAFIPTALFAILAVSSVASLGQNGRIGDSWYSSSSDGYYNYVASNNSWVWNASTSDSVYTSASYSGGVRDCMSNSSRSRSSYYNYGITFDNCTDEDNYVNALWHDKSHRFNTELTATVCQFFALFLHLVLFIWACVDTNRRNSRKVGKDAEKIAADIVQKMIQAGAIIPPPGAAHMRPMPGQMPMQNGQVPPQIMLNGQMQPQMMQQGQIPPHMMQQMFPQQYQQQYYGHFAPPAPQAEKQATGAVPRTVASRS
jgi:heme/copper-type cytochrome/quinol oxidase subunit 2